MKTGSENPKKWTPPEDAQPSSNGVGLAESPSTWTPPTDAEPVKKKESTGVSPVSESDTNEAGSAASSQPAPVATKPSKNPITGDLLIPEELKPIIEPLIVAGKQIYSGLGDQTPKMAVQAMEVGQSALKSASVEEFAKNKRPVEFQKFVRDKEGLSWYQPFDMDKYLSKYAQQFAEEKHPEELKMIEKNKPEIIQRRLEREQYGQQQNKEAGETLAGIPQSYKEIKTTQQAFDYAFNLGAQGLWQIPLTVLTKGLSGEMMEAASVYDSQLDQLAEKNKISREEVIKRGLDKPAEGQLHALAAAALDRASAGGLVDMVKKGGAPLLKKVIATTTEVLTEPTQGMLEEMGGAKGAGISQVEAFKKAWTTNLEKRINEGLGGFAGSTAINMVGSVPQVISRAKDNIKSTADQPNIEKAADAIVDKLKESPDEAVKGVEDKFKPLTTTPEEGVQNDSQNQQRVPGEVGGGTQPVQAQPNQGGSPQETSGGGVVQEPSAGQAQEVTTPIPEATQEGVNQTQTDEVSQNKGPEQANEQSTTSTTEAPGSLQTSETAPTNETTTQPGSNALPDQQAPIQRSTEQVEALLKSSIPKEHLNAEVEAPSLVNRGQTTKMKAYQARTALVNKFKALEKVVNCNL